SPARRSAALQEDRCASSFAFPASRAATRAGKEKDDSKQQRLVFHVRPSRREAIAAVRLVKEFATGRRHPAVEAQPLLGLIAVIAQVIGLMVTGLSVWSEAGRRTAPDRLSCRVHLR